MPDLQINQDGTVRVYFEENGRPVTGGNVTATVYNQATGAVLATGSANEGDLPGVYVYAISNSLLTGSVTRLRVTFSGASGAVDLYHEAFYSVGHAVFGLTRREIRNNAIGAVWGDDALWELAAGSSASNSTTTAYVPGLVQGGDGEWRGRFLRFLDGANAGETRRATGFAQATKLLSWTYPLVDVIATTDRMDLLPVNPDRADAYLNEALLGLGPGNFGYAEEDLLESDGTTSVFVLPADAEAIYQVGLTYTDSAGAPLWQGWLLPDDWRLVPGGRIELLGTAAYADGPLGAIWGYDAFPTGFTFRCRYLTRPRLPLTDFEVIDTDPTYLTYALASRLGLADPAKERVTNYLAQQAELWRPRAMRDRPPNTRAIQR